MLHGDSSPHPKKNPRTMFPCIPGTFVPLVNVPKLLETSLGTRVLVGCPQDIPNRFQGCSEYTSGMFLAYFKDFLGRFQQCFGQISRIIQAYNFNLTIMDIDD